MTDDEVMQAHKVYKTCLEMLNDRNYIPITRSVLSEDEFKQSQVNLKEYAVAHSSPFAELAQCSLLEYEQQYTYLFSEIYAEHKNRVPEGGKHVEIAVLLPVADASSRGFDVVLENLQNPVLDRVIVVSFADMPKKPVREKAEQMALEEKKILEIFDSKRLIFNVTKHFLVPKHELLTTEEKETVLKEYKVKEEELPVIEYDDPVGRYLGLLPGDVVMIVRVSQNSGKYVNFRICQK